MSRSRSHHESSKRSYDDDKYYDRDRDRHRHRNSRDRDRERENDRHRTSDRRRERDRNGGRDRERDRERDRYRDKDRDRDRDRDRRRYHDREREKDRHSKRDNLEKRNNDYKERSRDDTHSPKKIRLDKPNQKDENSVVSLVETKTVDKSDVNEDTDPSLKFREQITPGHDSVLNSDPVSSKVRDTQMKISQNMSNNSPQMQAPVKEELSKEEKRRRRLEILGEWTRKKNLEKAKKAEVGEISNGENTNIVEKDSEVSKPSVSEHNLTEKSKQGNSLKIKGMHQLNRSYTSDYLLTARLDDTNPPKSVFAFSGKLSQPSSKLKFRTKQAFNFEEGKANSTGVIGDPYARSIHRDSIVSTNKIKKSLEVGNMDVHNDLKETEGLDEVDPLDAFMLNMVTTEKIEKKEGDLMLSDDEDNRFGIDDTSEDQLNPDEVLANIQKKKQKEIKAVDHSKIAYEDFNKMFYLDNTELPTDLKDINELDQLQQSIHIRGKKCPLPILKWGQLGLPLQMTNVIKSLGYEKPTPIQSQALPAILSGRDVIGVANTGSGKTLAFLVPLFRQIRDQRPLKNMEGPLALVLTPTRELAVQIHKDCKPFLNALNLRAVCAYGGSQIKDQIADLKRGAEVVICTPGRMIDLLAANSGRVTNLRRVTYLVVDEADRMFDLGFEPQVMRIVNNVRPDRQTVVFSATFQKKMEMLARKILRRPLEIIVGSRSVVAKSIEQVVEVREDDSKFLRTLELLGEFYSKESDDSRALIFVERQEDADNLSNLLVSHQYSSCMSIHGRKNQHERSQIIADFKKGHIKILVATSLAARGLDVKQLNLVINYDTPNHLEDYVHRVGRTGRAGNTGKAVTFINPTQERNAYDIAKVLKQSEVEVPEDVQKLADSFAEKVKSGKERFNSGFGGKGLEKLEEIRNTTRKLERSAYIGGDDDSEKDKDENEKTEVETIESSAASKIVDNLTSFSAGANATLKVGDAPENRGPETSEYHATLTINNLPKRARWEATTNSNITKIIDQTGTSITTKGRYYDTEKGEKPGDGDEPPLYILVEGQTDVSVTTAVRELRTLLITGIEKEARDEARQPTGRYTL